MKKRAITYRAAGVDIKKGNRFVKQINRLVEATKKEGVISDIGFFSGLFQLEIKNYKEPVLVSSTDGVGTKLMIAQKVGIHNTIGIDLVAMCANDVATCGAKPLFFLDYIAIGKIVPAVLRDIVFGISKACRETGYALVGGETAEMPGMYAPDKYDLAGFCVGIVEKNDIIDGNSIKIGDNIIGLASNGLHSNGYSLIRKVFSDKEQIELKDELLKPTRLYVQPLLALQKRISIRGIAHITGGAYIDKIPRIIPNGLCAQIRKSSWLIPEIFRLIQKKGDVPEEEMYSVFNMGIGMIVVVSPKDIKVAQDEMLKFCITSWVIGEIVKGDKKIRIV